MTGGFLSEVVYFPISQSSLLSGTGFARLSMYLLVAFRQFLRFGLGAVLSRCFYLSLTRILTSFCFIQVVAIRFFLVISV
jgi:hypothetical protein